MKAHTVPVSYLARFAGGVGDPRRRKLHAFNRSGKSFPMSVGDATAVKNYYAAKPAKDAALFGPHERSWAQLLRTGDDSMLTPAMIWELKVRNRVILDFSRGDERLAVLAVARAVDLPHHQVHVVDCEPGAVLVTSDDPVTVLAVGNHPSEHGYAVALTPFRACFSVPTCWDFEAGAHLSTADAKFLNQNQCSQARNHAFARDESHAEHVDVSGLTGSAQESRSAIRGGHLILNYVGANFRSTTLSFLRPG